MGKYSSPMEPMCPLSMPFVSWGKSRSKKPKKVRCNHRSHYILIRWHEPLTELFNRTNTSDIPSKPRFFHQGILINTTRLNAIIFMGIIPKITQPTSGYILIAPTQGTHPETPENHLQHRPTLAIHVASKDVWKLGSEPGRKRSRSKTQRVSQ